MKHATMNKRGVLVALSAAAAGVALTGFAGLGWAQAQQAQQTYSADLQMLNNSQASGTATVNVVDDNTIQVEIRATGLTPDQPHAQHLHIGGQNACPTTSADSDGDGRVTTAEGQPSYGAVRVSLTTTGDVGSDSALAVDRFPVADASGNLNYSRSFDLPSGVTMDDIGDAVVVQHGIDLDDSGSYDGNAQSSLDPSLPLEATIPANCGKLTSAQGQGGANGTTTPSSGAMTPTPMTGGQGGADSTATPSSGTMTPTPASGNMAPPSTGDGGLLQSNDSMMNPLVIVASVLFGVVVAGVAVAVRWSHLR